MKNKNGKGDKIATEAEAEEVGEAGDEVAFHLTEWLISEEETGEK